MCSGDGDDLSASQQISLAKELSSLSSTRPHHETDTWTKEIALFMATAGKKKSTAISELASYISTIPPTSVEAGRTFSREAFPHKTKMYALGNVSRYVDIPKILFRQ